MNASVQEIGTQVEREFPAVTAALEQMSKVLVGQKDLVQRLMVGILGNGHILVEGVPGLAKTTAVKALASTIHADFQRIQFTPDLLPADILGTQIFEPKQGTFRVKKGPIFANIVLADEINRAPAKVQSALLEAMQERQVTIGEETFTLPDPFLVMATQNPIEQEGTYPLPEAQVDRFMLKVKVDYPNKAEEVEIMKRMTAGEKAVIEAILTPEKMAQLRRLVDSIFVDEKVFGYVADLVFATRDPESYGLKQLKHLIEVGGSPRASIFLIQGAKAYAFLNGRGYVTPQDIKSIGPDVLRHRVLVSYEAEAQNMTSDDVVHQIFDKIDVP